MVLMRRAKSMMMILDDELSAEGSCAKVIDEHVINPARRKQTLKKKIFEPIPILIANEIF